jgi:transcriptional regulator with AAA-type ATPase domain/tetratricopeptide (TPR) repeat protein
MAEHPTDALIGDAPALAELREQIRLLSAFDTPGNPNVPTVLLQGETGTGKGLVARVVHLSGGRSQGPFVDVNCAAIPETMLEAELFGFEAGAFTDAKRAKPGLFEAAVGGTLFLDEIDALPITLQGKLLKAIEEKHVRRLGGVASRHVDTKLIAATQKGLRELVASGAFRADLYHRLAVVILEIPPLRPRGADITALADHFLASHAAAHGIDPKHLDDDARRWLLTYDWPGNVRELSHLMERVTLLVPGVDVGRETLERLRVPLAPAAPTVPAPTVTDDEPTRIREALARSGGNVVRAARILGLGRNALRHRMRRYGIERPDLDVPASPPPAAPPATSAPVVDPQPSWEQKPVALLAIDLVLPEAAYEPWTLARRWETQIEERVGGFGGTVLTRAPSRLTAVFGIPRAVEQLPQRAVLAALAIKQLLTEGATHADAGAVPELRMAVHLGAVHVDVSPRNSTPRLLPVGDTLALAERLLGHAGNGEILLSAAVARRIESWCELRPRDLRVGESDTLHAHAVVGRRAARIETPIDVPGQSPFVGRERELDLLRESFESAAAGNGQVVFLVGEAGLGKSRLLAEFRQRLGETAHRWVEGRCASYGTTTAFLPIVDAMRHTWGIDDQDDEASATAKVEQAVGQLGDDLAWTLPFVRQVLALDPRDAAVAGLDSASRRSELFRAMRALTLRVAERSPLVLVMEDLHWIDPASEDYLAFIADVVPTTRAMMVVSYRPGYSHPFGDHSYHVRVTLRPLSSTEMADITGALLGTVEIPTPVRSLIAAKAEGNPFFVEEVTRSLLEDGTLRRENGRVLLARQLDQITVPDSIQDVLVARLDRLADDARRAIQVASVIGREFALRLLERITEAGARVRTHVEELRALELIYEKATHPELAYMFKHALTHDVAYESVLHDRRRILHGVIGAAIEELYADRLAEFYETLAYHFGRAESWERALHYHERAADKAAESFANRAVAAHCRHALAIADRLGAAVPDERRRRLEEQLALASFYVSDFAASGEAFDRAAERSADLETQGVNLAMSGYSFFWGHQFERADTVVDTAMALARRHHLIATEALAISHRGFFRGVCHGDIDFEEESMRAALGLAQASGAEAAIWLIRFNQAQMAEWTGDYRRAIAISEEVMEAGRRLRLAHLVVWPGWFLGKALCCLGDYGRAIDQLTGATEVCERIGDKVWKSRLLNTLGWCLAEIGGHARAREHNTRAAALAHEVGDPEIIRNSEINLATNHLALGDPERALAYFEPVHQAVASNDDPFMRWRYSLHTRHLDGLLALHGARPEHALDCAHVGIEATRRHRAPKLEARAHVLAGHALLTMDRRAEADGSLAEALGIADRIGYARIARETLGLLAESARRAGRRDEAERHDARRRSLVTAAMRSLSDGELRRQLGVEESAP